MTKNAEAKLAWLSDVLGVGKDEEPDGKMRKGGGFFDMVGDLVGQATNFVSRLFADPDVAEVQKALNTQVEGLEKAGLDTTRLKLDRQDQERALEAAAKLTDEGERKAATERARKRLQELESHAAALAKATKTVMGESKDAPDAAKRAAIYQKALEDHYGLTVKIPKGMTNTHMDRVFDMFGTVPRDQAKHRKLKKLVYSNASKDAGSGAYGGAEIEMGDFGSASGAEDYQIDGTTIPANSFDVTTLHEIGHALDDKDGIMNKHQGKPGCGGWKSESKASVADAMLAFFKKTVTVSDKMKPATVRTAIVSALGGTVPPAPDDAEVADWDKVRDFLGDYPMKSRSGASPWFKNAVDVDGRVYIESYADEWWSYTTAARAPTLVNKYQWRSPAEWFAEVYAISWLAKKKPPSGVDAAVAAYMWKA